MSAVPRDVPDPDSTDPDGTGPDRPGAGGPGAGGPGAGGPGGAGVDVEAAITVDDRAGGGRGRLTILHLGWRRRDPLAVDLHLTAQPDHPALPRGRWVVLRDFLRYGLEEPTGDGDVRIRPDGLGEQLDLELRRSGRVIRICVPRSAVRTFLDETERVVPAGEERPEAAIEELLRRLLRSS